MITAAAFEAVMVEQLTAVGRTKIDIAFRCNVSHAHNKHYAVMLAVMRVCIFVCNAPSLAWGAKAAAPATGPLESRNSSRDCLSE